MEDDLKIKDKLKDEVFEIINRCIKTTLADYGIDDASEEIARFILNRRTNQLVPLDEKILEELFDNVVNLRMSAIQAQEYLINHFGYKPSQNLEKLDTFKVCALIDTFLSTEPTPQLKSDLSNDICEKFGIPAPKSVEEIEIIITNNMSYSVDTQKIAQSVHQLIYGE